jgi:ureidoacrylate peracid hydrolase
MDQPIPTHDTALLLIDVQNGFLHPDGMAARMAGGTLPEASAATVAPLARTIAAARAAGIPIIYTQHAWRADLSDAGFTGEVMLRAFAQTPAAVAEVRTLTTGSWEAEILEELAPVEGDHRLPKNRYDAFLGTPLEQLLTRLGIRTLVVGGLITSCCVESTVRDAAMRDYRVLLVGDAIGDVDTAVHLDALARLERMFGHVVSSDDVAGAWALAGVVA